MAAYNERHTIAAIVHKVMDIPGLIELVIVDDGSTDGTSEIAEGLASNDARIKYIKQKNSGKSVALSNGFGLTTGDIVMVQDADLEYDPADVPDLIEPILQGHADVVFGSRFMVKRAARTLYFYHYLANKALTFYSNCLTNINLSDVETCYKAFRGEIIRNMIITSKGFGFEIEVTAKVAKLGCAIYEVPISYYGRTYEEGKKVGTIDGVYALWYIAKFNLLVPLRKSFRTIPRLVSADRKMLEGDTEAEGQTPRRVRPSQTSE